MRIGLTTRKPLREDTIEERSNTADVLLLDFHIDVNEPEIQSLRVAIHDTLEDRSSSFSISQLKFQLSEFRNRFDVYRISESVAERMEGERRLTLSFLERFE